MKLHTLIIGLLVGCGWGANTIGRSGVALAGDDAPRDAKIRIEKLALFKNGLGFIVASAELPAGARNVRLGRFPIPSFGTFWVQYPKDIDVRSIVTSMEETEKELAVQSIGQLLAANPGRRAILHLQDRSIEGTILAGSVGYDTVETTSPYFMSSGQGREAGGQEGISSQSGNLILMRTDRGVTGIAPGSIQRAEFTDGSPITTTTRRQKRPALFMRLAKPAGGEKITISYLAHGMTWAPGYLIDLSDPQKATFSAHAVVVNEMTDVTDVSLKLVTGFPNIKFGDVSSPMAKSQSLADFLGALTGSGARRDGADYMTQQRIMMNAPPVFGSEESSLLTGYSTAGDGMVAEDLFFYPVGNVSLRRDETAWIPLFTAEMPYRHVYTWDIGDFVDPDDRYRSSRTSQDRATGEEVWHACRLLNTLNMPLTTATTEFMTNGEFTGQDVCSYTPPKVETTIRINKALNLMTEQAEFEVDRKREASMIHGYRYDLVTVRGELKIRSKLPKNVNVEITKELSGELLESAPKCTDTKTAKGLKKVNPKHQLTWTIALKPDQEQMLTYQYQVFIRE